MQATDWNRLCNESLQGNAVTTLRCDAKRGLSKSMGFGSRLAEERKRLGLKQAEFASLVGTDVPKQSLYENDRRELRAAYLARLAAARVDVGYILTARRSEGTWLSEEASALLSSYLALPPELQQALLRFVEDLNAYFAQDHGRPGRSPAEEPD
jgi:transcriptional regulator with XRE-family HTH domain